MEAPAGACVQLNNISSINSISSIFRSCSLPTFSELRPEKNIHCMGANWMELEQRIGLGKMMYFSVFDVPVTPSITFTYSTSSFAHVASLCLSLSLSHCLSVSPVTLVGILALSFQSFLAENNCFSSGNKSFHTRGRFRIYN